MKNKYIQAQKEHNIYLLSISLNQEAFSHKIIEEYLKLPCIKDDWLIFEKGHETRFSNRKIFNFLGKAISERIEKDKNYSHIILKKTKELGSILYNNCYKIIKILDEQHISSLMLTQTWKKVIDYFFEICSIGVGAVFSDLEDNRFSNLLEKIVEEKIEKYNLKKSLGGYIGVLAGSLIKAEGYKTKKELLNIYRAIQKLGLEKRLILMSPNQFLVFLKSHRAQLLNKLDRFVYRFSWIEYGHFGPEINSERLINRLKNIAKDKKERILLEEATNFNQQSKLQKQYTKDLRLNAKERYYFKTAREFSGAKLLRQELMFLTYYALGQALKYLAGKYKYSIKELQNMSHMEFISLMEKGKLLNKKVLNERFNFCVSWVIDLNNVKIFIGEKAKLFIKKNFPKENILEKAEVIKGNIAYPGKVCGIVKLINIEKDIGKMEKGNILVVEQTNPQLLPAMKLAAAFVTDVGGITCHAAIVSRELGIPCIIGTKIATKVLKDGDLVEVDADKGMVRIIKK